MTAVRNHSHSHSQLDHSHSHDCLSQDHDHVHLKSSETETNDELHFGVKNKPFVYIGSKEFAPLVPPTATTTASSKSHSHSHSAFAPHTHSHSELYQGLTARSVLRSRGARITAIGLLTNIGMALAKGVGGVAFHSQALIADAMHLVLDLVLDFLTLFTIQFLLRDTTKVFPNGYGKIELLGLLLVSLLLLVAGVLMGFLALQLILGPIVPEQWANTVAYYKEALHLGHGHSHSHSHAVTDINAAWIAGGLIVVKEWLYQATKKVAVEQNLNVLLANAWHHRMDLLTLGAALITISGGYYFGVSWLDPMGGLIVSLLICKAGYDGVRALINELVDRAVPTESPTYKDLLEEVQGVLNGLVSNNNSRRPYIVGDMVVLSSGPNYVVDKLQLVVPKQKYGNVLSITEFENISRVVKEKLFSRKNLKKVNIEFVEEEEAPATENTTKNSNEHIHEHSH